MRLNRVDLAHIGNTRTAARIQHRAAHLRKDKRIVRAIGDLTRIADRRRAVAPAADPGKAFQRNAALCYIFCRTCR